MELSVQLLLEMLGHGETQDHPLCSVYQIIPPPGPGYENEDAEDLEETLYGVLNVLEFPCPTPPPG